VFVEVIQVQGPTNASGKGGKAYQVLEVAYKDQAGRVQGKKLLSFQNPDVFKLFSTAQQGDKFDVNSEKVGDFWNWTRADVAFDVPASPAASSSSPARQTPGTAGKVTGSNYETPSERAVNRERIGRQAALNTATAILTATKKAFSVDDVLGVAGTLEQWVHRDSSAKEGQMSLPKAMRAISELENDIPE